MFPFGFAVGAVVGAAAAVLLGPQLVQRGRPAAKSALKAALAAVYEARIRGAEVTEGAEDLFAEAKAEVTEELVAARLAAFQARAEAEAEAEAQQAAEAQAAAGATAAKSATKRPGTVKRPAARRRATKRAGTRQAATGSSTDA